MDFVRRNFILKEIVSPFIRGPSLLRLTQTCASIRESMRELVANFHTVRADKYPLIRAVRFRSLSLCEMVFSALTSASRASRQEMSPDPLSCDLFNMLYEAASADHDKDLDPDLSVEEKRASEEVLQYARKLTSAEGQVTDDLAQDFWQSSVDHMLRLATFNEQRDLCFLAKSWGATDYSVMIDAAVEKGDLAMANLAIDWSISDPHDWQEPQDIIPYLIDQAAFAGNLDLCKLALNRGQEIGLRMELHRLFAGAAFSGNIALCQFGREWAHNHGQGVDINDVLEVAAKSNQIGVCLTVFEWNTVEHQDIDWDGLMYYAARGSQGTSLEVNVPRRGTSREVTAPWEGAYDLCCLLRDMCHRDVPFAAGTGEPLEVTLNWMIRGAAQSGYLNLIQLALTWNEQLAEAGKGQVIDFESMIREAKNYGNTHIIQFALQYQRSHPP